MNTLNVLFFIAAIVFTMGQSSGGATTPTPAKASAPAPKPSTKPVQPPATTTSTSNSSHTTNAPTNGTLGLHRTIEAAIDKLGQKMEEVVANSKRVVEMHETLEKNRTIAEEQHLNDHATYHNTTNELFDHVNGTSQHSNAGNSINAHTDLKTSIICMAAVTVIRYVMG